VVDGRTGCRPRDRERTALLAGPASRAVVVRQLVFFIRGKVKLGQLDGWGRLGQSSNSCGRCTTPLFGARGRNSVLLFTFLRNITGIRIIDSQSYFAMFVHQDVAKFEGAPVRALRVEVDRERVRPEDRGIVCLVYTTSP